MSIKVQSVVLLSLSVAFLAGCGKEKEEALASIESIKTTCDSDAEAGKKLGQDAYAKNPKFKAAIDLATPEVADKSELSYCTGMTLMVAKSSLKNL